MEMTQREKEVRALRIDIENDTYTINEVREKLGEPKVAEPEADQFLILTEKAGWLHLVDNTPVKVRIEALLPKAFASVGLTLVGSRGEEVSGALSSIEAV